MTTSQVSHTVKNNHLSRDPKEPLGNAYQRRIVTLDIHQLLIEFL